MCDCSRFIYVCFSHNPSTLTHPSSLFPSKLLLPLSWHATLTLKKSAGLWIYFTPLSLSPCPAFSGRAQKNKAGKRHFCPTTALAAVCSLVPLAFWGSDVLVVVILERCYHTARRSCSTLGCWRDCHLKFALNTHSAGFENLNSNFPTICMSEIRNLDHKAFDTEPLQLVQENSSRVAKQFSSSYCWEAKPWFWVLRVAVYSAESYEGAGREINDVRTEHAPSVAPRGFLSTTGWSRHSAR